MFAKLETTNPETIKACLKQAVEFIKRDEYYPSNYLYFGTGLVDYRPDEGLKFKGKHIKDVTIDDLGSSVGWTTCRGNWAEFAFFREGDKVVKVELKLEGQRNGLQFLSKDVVEGVWEVVSYNTHAEFLHPFETLGQWIARSPFEAVFEMVMSHPEWFYNPYTAQEVLEKLHINGHSQARLSATFNSEELKVVRKLSALAEHYFGATI